MTGFCGRGFLSLLILAAVFLAHGVCAEETVKKQSEYNLGEVPVVGKRLKEPVTSPYAVPESSQIQTEVITAEDVQNLHPATLWDVFEQIPGMDVTYQGRQHIDSGNTRTGGYGVILDGVYMPTTTRILATLPIDAIESMTFVRDATALLLGPLTNFGTSTGSSNQGFVVIKTKRSSKLEGGLIGSYGTFDTQKAHLYQGSKIGNFDYRLAATYNSTDGKNDGEMHEWYNGSDNRSLLFRGGYTASAFNADLLYYHSRGMREFQRGTIRDNKTVKYKDKPGPPVQNNIFYEPGELDGSKWKIDPMTYDAVAVNLSKPWNNTQTTTLQYAYSRLQVHTVQGSFLPVPPSTYAPPSGESESDQDTYNQNASLRHIVNWRNNTFRVGGQFLAYRSPDGVAPSTGKPFNERMYSLFAHDECRMLNDRLTVDGGIRVDRKYYVNGPGQGQPMHDWADPTYTLAFGASYKLNSIFTMTGRYAYSENSEGDYQVSADGSNLSPEKRSRYEVGVLANVHPAFNPWITLYYYDTNDQKVTQSSIIDPTTGDEIDYVTAEDVITKGLEIGVNGQIWKPFTYNLNYSYKVTNSGTANQGMAHHLASARLNYQYKNAFANVSVRYVGSKTRCPYGGGGGVKYYPLDDYTRFDANVGYDLKIYDRETRLTLYGRNLGDKHYANRYVSGAYYDPGRQIGVELAVSFF